MKKVLLSLLLIGFIGITSSNAQAVWRADGTVIGNFTATDINNQSFSSSVHTASGKHFLIDISATWCGPCWSYHGTHVLKNYYEQYGPSGTVEQDAEVLYYEADGATNMNDLNGIGTNTVGDWVTGTPYLIFNESNPGNVFWKFLDPSSTSISYPSVFVVCSDRKMYRLSTGITNPAQVRTFVEQKCGLAPLSASSISGMDFEYDVYPNPASNKLSIDLKLDNAEKVSYSLINTFGQVLTSVESTNMSAGLNKVNINLDQVAAGMYLLNLTVGESNVSHKIMVSK